MNAIFIIVTLVSAIIMCIFQPSSFLYAVLDGGLNAAKCALTLFCIYAFWMGLSSVAEECKITHAMAHLLSSPCKKIFKTRDELAIKNISMNISCNLLGIGGAATPYGVAAIEQLEKTNNFYAQNLLYIINATSIQLLPTTVIALRASFKSASAYDITLPSIICTFISTFVGVSIYVVYSKIKAK